MENISLRLETKFLKELEELIKKHNYMTKTEFIREAIRDKIIELEKQETLNKIEKLFGSSKRKTTDEDLHKVREKLAKDYEKKFS
jgi:metal-responsive CopG/Arc/MetJ family transcriptional regulator